MKEGRDYTIKYTYGNNKKVGKATVSMMVKYKGNYTGTVKGKKTFEICPKGTKLKKAKGYKKSVYVKWKKRSGVSGYTVYLENANGKICDYYVFKGQKRTSLKITGLKRHTKYYVSVGTYKKVKGKKYYSITDSTKVVRTH